MKIGNLKHGQTLKNIKELMFYHKFSPIIIVDVA